MRYFLSKLAILLSFTITHAQPSDLTAKIDQIFSSRYSNDAPGCTVLIARKGEIIYRRAFGMANLELNVPMVPENVFRIASLTKQFTAVAILQLHEKELLNIDDDIKKYIPDFPSTNKIIIANLMSHTSGIKNITDEIHYATKRKSSTPLQLVELIKSLPSDFKPGTAYAYSNSGFILLGYIIEKVSGKSYEQYVSENIFKPLKMNSAYYDHFEIIVPGRANGYVAVSDKEFKNADFIDQSFPYSAGALMMSIDDMFKWNKGLYTYSIIKKETLDKAFTPFTLADGHQISYGYGWGLATFMNSKITQHGGGIDGFASYVIYFPAEDLFAVSFSNVMNKDITGPTLLGAAAALGKLKQASVPEKIKDRYLGTYQFPDGHQVNIYKEATTYFLKDANSTTPWKMYFTDEKSFYCEEVFPNNHIFSIDSSGKVEAFFLHFDGGEPVRINRIN